MKMQSPTGMKRWSVAAWMLPGLLMVGIMPSVLAQEDAIFQVEGVLTEGDATIPEGNFYDTYYFEGQAGKTVQITVESGKFDAIFGLFGPQQEGLIARNNLDNVTTDAGIIITLAENGTYGLLIRGFDVESQGRYRIVVREVMGLVVQRSPESTDVRGS